jgi:hypothetical protein
MIITNEKGVQNPARLTRPYLSTYVDLKTGITYEQTQSPIGNKWKERASGSSSGLEIKLKITDITPIQYTTGGTIDVLPLPENGKRYFIISDFLLITSNAVNYVYSAVGAIQLRNKYTTGLVSQYTTASLQSNFNTGASQYIINRNDNVGNTISGAVGDSSGDYEIIVTRAATSGDHKIESYVYYHEF